MATLNIKDPRVYELASELADRRKTSMTAAVRSALEDALAAELSRLDAEYAERLRQIDQAVAQFRAGQTLDPLTDDDLYDPETGLPW